MGTVRADRAVPLDVEAAMALWTDVERWPQFVGGFSHVLDMDDGWPAVGSTVVWQSIPRGRGRVTERVVELEPGRRIATEVEEEALTGRQTVGFAPSAAAPDDWVDDPDAAGVEPAAPGPPTALQDPGSPALVELVLDYRLAQFGPLRGVADVLFVRRPLRDAQARTLGRFAAEAERETAL